MKILFNTEEASKLRPSEERLTTEEEISVVQIVSDALEFYEEKVKLSDETKALIQKFFFNYENMLHYTHYTGGLFCTENPEKYSEKEEDFFQLWYGENKSEK